MSEDRQTDRQTDYDVGQMYLYYDFAFLLVFHTIKL